MEFKDANPQDYKGIVHCIYHGFNIILKILMQTKAQ